MYFSGAKRENPFLCQQYIFSCILCAQREIKVILILSEGILPRLAGYFIHMLIMQMEIQLFSIAVIYNISSYYNI